MKKYFSLAALVAVPVYALDHGDFPPQPAPAGWGQGQVNVVVDACLGDTYAYQQIVDFCNANGCSQQVIAQMESICADMDLLVAGLEPEPVPLPEIEPEPGPGPGGLPAPAPGPVSPGQMRIPVGVTFDPVVTRSGGTSSRNKPLGGDNFTNTWADDDRIYVTVDDGNGWPAASGSSREWNNRAWALTGGPNNLRANYLGGFPSYPRGSGWYGFGMVSVDGVLYYSMTIPYRAKLGNKLVYSPNNGASWFRHNGVSDTQNTTDYGADKFFFSDSSRSEGHRFAYLDFVQMGRDYELSRVYPGDTQEYVYLYSKKDRPRPAVYHARVPKNHESITDPNAYEYFAGYDGENARWTRNMAQAYQFPIPSGYFHSAWLPSVSYNPGLNVYIMMQGGRQGNMANGQERRCLSQYPSRLMLSWAPNPWGPWTKFYDNSNWVGDDRGNSLYQPKLVPKFTSADGRTMHYFYSDCREDWGPNYRLNQQRMVLDVR